MDYRAIMAADGCPAICIREPLTPQEAAALARRTAKWNAGERTFKVSRRKASGLGMSPFELKTAGAKLVSERKPPDSPVASEGESAMARKTAKKAKAAKPKAKAAPAKKSEVKAGSKLEIIVGLLKRPEGCTTKEVLAATNWPTVSMPQQAALAGIKLVKEKFDGVTRYRAA